ncbi:hypothetical protein MJO29_015212 [Puccinia striiformis f. sp. tritici]|uniref:Uncharacterized protein n=1 Tax=Puccinia striiformis TaxID=27350 RepID=A0A2S4U9Z5_9BASI|nr:hypothetical protein MJO29_015212 [Puccinia striiformis f. sp. tritici]POV93994.1 hypothetical protein PSHT_16492 [Puccinia striiformis]
MSTTSFINKMNISSLAAVINLLVGITFASQTSPRYSVSRLIRRDNSQAEFTNMYFMKDTPKFSQGGLKIYHPDGSTAFVFEKTYQDVRRGKSSVVLKNQDFQPLMALNSENDLCYGKSDYVEPDSPSSRHHVFAINPRGPLVDRWTLRFIGPSGKEVSFRYERNVTNKGGKIYYEAKEDKDEVYVGVLDIQTRFESWMKPGANGARAFTLSCTAAAPQAELATLMALVLTRVDLCGL